MDIDKFNLDRFLAAQNSGNEYDTAVAELRRGRKASHWMWYVFPQIAGLGHSSTSRFYAISGVPEAEAYLDHPVLGPRLIAVTNIVQEHTGKSAESIFGSIDAQKLRSSMTLFARAAASAADSTSETPFRRILDEFFNGQEDGATTELL